MLRDNKVIQSLSNSGKPYDNAVAEAFFSSLKRENLYISNYRSESAFSAGVDEYMDDYNTRRPRAGINYKFPEQFDKSFS
ncbi:MAG: integrase core domain-containing protein [Christensenellales bacterium]